MQKRDEECFANKVYEIKNTCKVFFERLMNKENEWSGRLKRVGLVRAISLDAVRRAINDEEMMKNGKAPNRIIQVY